MLFLHTISATYPAITSVTAVAIVYAADVTTPWAADDTYDAKDKIPEVPDYVEDAWVGHDGKRVPVSMRDTIVAYWPTSPIDSPRDIDGLGLHEWAQFAAQRLVSHQIDWGAQQVLEIELHAEVTP